MSDSKTPRTDEVVRRQAGTPWWDEGLQDHARTLEIELAATLADSAELNALFALQRRRGLEALAMWRAGHPERSMSLPDRCDLVTWLLDRMGEKTAELETVKAERGHWARECAKADIRAGKADREIETVNAERDEARQQFCDMQGLEAERRIELTALRAKVGEWRRTLKLVHGEDYIESKIVRKVETEMEKDGQG